MSLQDGLRALVNAVSRQFLSILRSRLELWERMLSIVLGKGKSFGLQKKLGYANNAYG